MLNNYICALDISPSKIAAVVAQTKRKSVTELFFEAVPSKGIRRGTVTDSIGLISCIDKALGSLKAKSRIKIKSVYVNISGQDIVTKHSHAVIPLAERGNKIITLSDIRRVNEQARILASSLEEEIIHYIPFGYTIDSRGNILNPLGLYSHRLEVDLFLVCARLSSVQSLIRALNQAGYEVKDLLVSGLANVAAILGKKPAQGINIICDIGSDTTEIMLVKDGVIRDIEILPVGGDDLTAALQEELKIPFELAEDVKRSHGVIGEHIQIDEDKEILVKKSDIYKPIKQKLITEILTVRARSVCQVIKEALCGKVEPSQISNVMTCGRTILLEGFLEMLEDSLGMPVKTGRINLADISSFVNKEDVLSGNKYLMYLTSLAILCDAFRKTDPQFLPISQPPQNLIAKTINRLQEVYQEYF